MTPRRLTFAVGTSLLTASLATTGCAKKHVNEGPEPPHVNTAAPGSDDATPQPDDAAPQPEETTDNPEKPPEDIVNVVPSL